ncbi:unnamed protein product [Larinioides sclopetarius]|uniref:Uncharacterized protein n=1 Tax=Larinioides sclopetarius TaxID=280406 RepID=A0AAV2A3W1_9ARAC
MDIETVLAKNTFCLREYFGHPKLEKSVLPLKNKDNRLDTLFNHNDRLLALAKTGRLDAVDSLLLVLDKGCNSTGYLESICRNGQLLPIKVSSNEGPTLVVPILAKNIGLPTSRILLMSTKRCLANKSVTKIGIETSSTKNDH